MSGLTRRLRRAKWGVKEFKRKWPRPEVKTVVNPDGGYTADHPTKGPRRFSAKRVLLYG